MSGLRSIDLSQGFPISIWSRVKNIARDKMATKNIDVGRWIQVILLLITLGSVFLRSSEIINNQKTLDSKIDQNEIKRDLKEQLTIKELAEIRKELLEEQTARKFLQERFDKLRDIYLINIGKDPEAKTLK